MLPPGESSSVRWTAAALSGCMGTSDVIGCLLMMFAPACVRRLNSARERVGLCLMRDRLRCVRHDESEMQDVNANSV